MPPARARAAAAAAAPEHAPFFAGCVVLLIPDVPTLRGACARALATVIARHGGKTVALPPAGAVSRELPRATHALSGAEAADAPAAALAAVLPPDGGLSLPPLLRPDWVYRSAAERRLLPWQEFVLPPRPQPSPRRARPSLPAERNVALAAQLLARGAELAAANGGCTHRAAAFKAAADALRTLVPFELTAASLARLPRHAHGDGRAPGWAGLRLGDAPLEALHAALGQPPPPRPAGLAVKPPPPPEPEQQPGCRLLSSPLLSRILALLPPAALVHASCTCRMMHRAAFAAPGLPSAARLRVMTWNIKNNGEDRHSGQPRGEGCQVWDVRRAAVAAAVAAQAPSLLLLQEDKDAMLTVLFATAAMAHSRLRCFPQPGERRDEQDVPVLTLPSDPPGAELPPPPGAPPPWERCCIVWDDTALQRVQAGQFRWRDGRAAQPGATRTHFLPMTWMLLRWRARPGGADGGLLLVLNAHFEAGHHWMQDVPAKQRSAALFSAAASALRARFGARVPVICGGDWNMQKTQLSYKLLVGDAQVGMMPEHAPAARRAAAARVPVPALSCGGAAAYDVQAGPLAEFVDVFDAWLHDCPLLSEDAAPSVPAPFGTLGAPGACRARTGGHDGTTWHAFVHAAAAVAVSDSMRDSQIQHRSRADGADGGARGHQRHIDAIMLCAAASARGAVRVRAARVLTHRQQCGVTGGCALQRLIGGAREDDDDAPRCCRGEGGWGSDHFPVVADLTLFFT